MLFLKKLFQLKHENLQVLRVGVLLECSELSHEEKGEIKVKVQVKTRLRTLDYDLGGNVVVGPNQFMYYTSNIHVEYEGSQLFLVKRFSLI